jgi:hypothetical protein
MTRCANIRSGHVIRRFNWKKIIYTGVDGNDFFRENFTVLFNNQFNYIFTHDIGPEIGGCGIWIDDGRLAIGGLGNYGPLNFNEQYTGGIYVSRGQ